MSSCSSSEEEDSSTSCSSSESSEENGGGIELHDGEERVSTITVMALFRNNAKYLSAYLLPRLAILEDQYDVEFQYFFLENNSKDDTRALLQGFLQGRKGRVKTLDLPDFENLGVNFERTDRLAFLRNSLLFDARPDIPTAESWCLLIDSDICFDVMALRDLFAKEPSKHDIAMLSAFTTEALFGRQLKQHPQYKDCKDDDMITFNHYADTFAYVGMDGRNLRPKCAFASCKMCNVNKVAKEGVLEVRSCYNGFAIVQGACIKDDRVKWDTVDLEGRISLCEHVLFCHALRASSGKKVCVATEVDKVFWTNP